VVVHIVTSRPRANLGRVLGDLGATLLELVHGDLDSPDEIGGIAIHDPLDDAVLPRHALVLGVGLRDADEIAHLLTALGPQRAAGLIVRAPVPLDAELKAASAQSGVALLGFTRGASWTQLAAVLRSLLAEGDVGVTEPESLGGFPAGDLFALANAIAALLDAPITIEDRNSRVLAFSGRQDEADPSRVETILGRQVPERYARMLEERGVFRDLYRSDRPVHVAPLPGETDEFTLPRVAVAVRAGDEVLGSIWAAVHEPLSAEREQAFRDAAKLVALHMLRVRAGADVERRLRADLVGTALEGGSGAREALSRLGLVGQPIAVFALTLPRVRQDPGSAAAAALIGERQRLADAFAMHLSAVHPGSAAALVSDIVYGLVPVANHHGDGEQRALRIATEFLDRIGMRANPVIAVGPVANDVAGLARSRVTADRVVRVLRDGDTARRVACLADIHVEALMFELHDLVSSRGDQPTGAVARIIRYDAEHGTALVATLRAWLDAFGDVGAAAASLFVHPNTFRYRLRRLAEVGGIDLADPEARFAAMVQLRIVVSPEE
jgi:hypothetical protein